MTFIPQQKLTKTAFDEVLMSELTPKVQLQFPYNINSHQVVSFPGNGGAVTAGNNHADLSSGTNSDGFAFIISNDALKYNAGQGGLFRGTCLFTPGVADSSQIIGLGNNLNGYFFGYDGVDFGVLRRSSGQPETRTLTVTTGSTTAENITITLDGDSIATVAVTNSGDPTVTAREISDAFYASVGTGWGAVLRGDQVEFISFDTAAHNGVYAISGTTVAGAYAQTIAAVAAVDNWIAQTSWNGDPMDGNGPSGVTLDQTKGNVYQIRYQWLGYGTIEFSVEDPETGGFQMVHRIKYPNANTEPSTGQPTFRLFMQARNEGGTTDMIMRSSSMAGFVEGKEMNLGPRHGRGNLFNIGPVTTEEPVITIRNKQIYQSNISEVRLIIERVSFTSDLATGDTTFRVYEDASPEFGTSYVDVELDGSVVEFDVAALSFDISDALLLETFTLSNNESLVINEGDFRDLIPPGRTIMITAQPSKSNAGNVVGATISWRELF